MIINLLHKIKLFWYFSERRKGEKDAIYFL